MSFISFFRRKQMADKLKYSDHIETITALVSYLALWKGKSRTPGGVAGALGLDKSEVWKVLDGFSGIFRKSKNPSSNPRKIGQHYYTLHVRYATRHLDSNKTDEDNPEFKIPLAGEYLSTILAMIQERANMEN
tara:strand:- start:101 stop:499 length:399 start_codon:yes stop_codon:yes gene_type:complete